MFLPKFKSDSGDRSPFGSFWFEPIGFRSGAQNVTGDSALQLAAVYACVRVLTDTVSMLPFIVYRENRDGGKTQIKDHWLYRLLARRPNDFQNPMEFREMMQGHLTLRGNAFAQIHANGSGEVTDLIPIHPDRVTIEMLTDSNWRYRVTNGDGSQSLLARRDVFHIKGLSANGVIGYNPIQLARNIVGTGMAAQDYGRRFFENDAKPGGWIGHPSHFKDDAQRRLWRDQWQEMQTGANKHKTAVLEYGMTYNETKVSNDDAQFIETKKMSRSEIATMFRIPPHMIGDLEKATFSNIEQQSIDFVVHSLTPWLVRWEEAIRFNFLDPYDDTINIGFPVTALLRGDSTARSTYINQGVMNGTLTRNEGRLMEDRNPIPGLDEPLRPLNMVEESAAVEDDAEAEANEMAPAQKKTAAVAVDDLPMPESTARFSSLARATAERLARKECEMLMRALKRNDWPEAVHEAYEKHSHFLAAALGVSPDIAKAYCTARGKDPIRQGSEEADIYAASLQRLTKLALEGKV